MSDEEQELWMTSLLDRRVFNLEKEVAEFEPDWMQYKMGLRDGYAAAKEQAAKVCHDYATRTGLAGNVRDCAEEIRAMKVEK
jgi:hypothetical protein